MRPGGSFLISTAPSSTRVGTSWPRSITPSRRRGRKTLPAATFVASSETARVMLCARAITGLPRKASRRRQGPRDLPRVLPRAPHRAHQAGCRTRAPCSTSFAATSLPSAPTSHETTTELDPRATRRAKPFLRGHRAGGDIRREKPSPLPVLEIAAAAPARSRQLVMVGDGPQDIEAGRRAGMPHHRRAGRLLGARTADRWPSPTYSSIRWPSSPRHRRAVERRDGQSALSAERLTLSSRVSAARAARADQRVAKRGSLGDGRTTTSCSCDLKA